MAWICKVCRTAELETAEEIESGICDLCLIDHLAIKHQKRKCANV